MKSALGKVNNENESPPSAKNVVEALEPNSGGNQDGDMNLEQRREKRKRSLSPPMIWM